MKSICTLMLVAVIAGGSNIIIAQDTVPETVVELSIYDLIKKTGHAKKINVFSKLPKDYGNQIIKVLQENRAQMLACVSSDSNAVFKYQTKLSIAGTGKAEVKFTDAEVSDKKLIEAYARTSDCVLKILSGIAFPKHPLKNQVVVSLPLKLEKERI